MSFTTIILFFVILDGIFGLDNMDFAASTLDKQKSSSDGTDTVKAATLRAGTSHFSSSPSGLITLTDSNFPLDKSTSFGDSREMDIFLTHGQLPPNFSSDVSSTIKNQRRLSVVDGSVSNKSIRRMLQDIMKDMLQKG